jgi:arginase family enzyme
MLNLSSQLLGETYIAIPALEVLHRDGAPVLANRVLGTEAALDAALSAVLAAFERPRAIGAALEQGIQPMALRTAMERGFILKLDVLVGRSDAHFAVGAPTSLSALLTSNEPVDLAVFGAPIDAAATGQAGARNGPEEIRAAAQLPMWSAGRTSDRVAGSFGAPETTGPAAFLDLDYRRTYTGEVPSVVDLGDVTLMPGESIRTYGARLGLVTSLLIERGVRPALLGGDHSTSSFVLEALLKRHPRLGVIHFDAHPDMVPPFAGMDYVTHAMPFWRARRSNSLAILLQLGLRVLERVGRDDLVDDPRVRYRSARELQRLAPEEVFAELPRDIPYYLSFDIDCIDPRWAPETGTPVAGGLSPYQAAELVDHAARALRLVGWDIVEVGSRGGAEHGAAAVAAMLVKQLVLSSMRFEPLRTYVRAR